MLDLFLAAALAASLNPAPASNTLCPVLGNPVDAGSKVVVVRGRQYRICCAGCDKKLAASPDQYLEKDGTPMNARMKGGDKGGGHHH